MDSIMSTSSKPVDSPWWVRAIERFGVPAAIAMYLIWVMTTGQTDTLRGISETLQAQKTKVAEVAIVTKQTAEEIKAASVRQEIYLRLLCVNTAKSTQDRNTCLSVR